MDLVLRNNTTKNEIVLSGVTDNGTNALFYQFTISLPNLTDEGEYEYQLKDGNTVLAVGLCQIGSYTPNKTTYHKENNGYITYNG